jgi:uncharacterized protein with GYD domain
MATLNEPAKVAANKGGFEMPVYVALGNWTQKGLETIKSGPERLQASKQLFEAAGARLMAFHLLMGKYDMVAIFEAADNETAMKIGLALGAHGTVRGVVMPALSEQQYVGIVEALGQPEVSYREAL